MVAWDDADGGRVKVGPWPDTTEGWSDGYLLTAGWCDTAFTQCDESEQEPRLLARAAHLMFGGAPRRRCSPT